MKMKMALFTVLFGVLRPSLAVDLATAMAAYDYFDKTDRVGGIACVAHLGPSQCRRPDRCADGLGYVRGLANGLPSAAAALDEWMGRSSMNRDCGYSLLGGTTSALFRDFQYLVEFSQQQGNGADNQVRGASYARSRYQEYGLKISDSDSAHWNQHLANVGKDTWEKDFHRDVVQRLFSQCHDPIGRDLQHWTDHSFNVPPSNFVHDVRKDWRCKPG